MVNGIIQHITNELKRHSRDVVVIRTVDPFLLREDVVEAFKELGVEIVSGSSLTIRLRYELRESDMLFILVTDNNTHIAEDILQSAAEVTFTLKDYMPWYHQPTIENESLDVLDALHYKQHYAPLKKRETEQLLEQVKKELEQESAHPPFDLNAFWAQIDDLLMEEHVNWDVIGTMIAHAVAELTGSPNFSLLQESIEELNSDFQSYLQANYKQKQSSNYIKRPHIVSHIVNYLNSKHNKDKIALIVVDGLALWQYQLIEEQLPGKKNREVIYSWLPSITQLSRQAIFRGDVPDKDYRQNPRNEGKLWREFWESKGINVSDIHYQHNDLTFEFNRSVSKLAVVLTHLDNQMHGLTNFMDLKSITLNWMDTGKLSDFISQLRDQGFKVFLTSDHGNIEAKGWRGLSGREKIGTHKSGSRSQRHIEYSNEWSMDDLLKNNPELEKKLIRDDNTAYFSSSESFSTQEAHVTHGGAHLLEVLIPFVEIE